VFISHAQNFVDAMLWRALKSVNHGFYIDVGAAWPDKHSVTKALYDRGWRGINIEPNPEMWRLLSADRQRDINLKLALSDQPGQREIQLFADTGLSTMDPGVAALHEASGYHAVSDFVEVSTLSDVWREHVGSQDVHFLKIDVEGTERQVLLGNDWSRNRPWILVIEATVPTTPVRSHEQWESIILNSNYLMAYDDGLNRFYVAAEHQGLLPAFSSPPNVFDNLVPAEQLDAASRARAADARAQVADARLNAAELRARRAEARGNSAEVLKRHAEARANSAEALQREAEARARAAEAHARVTELATREVQARLHKVAARAHAATIRARRAEARAQRAKARLTKMRATFSWRATRPIRAVARIVLRRLNVLRRSALG
jgi:FkbM family methyltransferase